MILWGVGWECGREESIWSLGWNLGFNSLTLSLGQEHQSLLEEPPPLPHSPETGERMDSAELSWAWWFMFVITKLLETGAVGLFLLPGQASLN